MKYLISVSYDGSKFQGLQKLKSGLTVQGILEKTLSICDESNVKVVSSGRTDKGVHAIDQKCTFNLNKNINPYKLKGYLNRSTSPYLFVKTCETIEDENFHARFSVKTKTYKYVINTGDYDPIKEDYLYNYNKKDLDTDKMTQASSLFEGPHYFKAFVTGKHETYDSIIDKIEIVQIDDIIEIKIKGKAFYTYMVRNIVKVLILVGNGTITLEEVNTMLQTGKKTIEYSPAPPGGLYLYKIDYE